MYTTYNRTDLKFSNAFVTKKIAALLEQKYLYPTHDDSKKEIVKLKFTCVCTQIQDTKPQ